METPIRRGRGRPKGSKNSPQKKSHKAALEAKAQLFSELRDALHNCAHAGGDCSQLRVCVGESCRALNLPILPAVPEEPPASPEGQRTSE